ncbi:MAG TPA: type VI secretion system-associated protein TagF [Polyangiaceae bacterium]|nr:type VI secretion system-associated protein TagF [Polyangiaceae bacterium]
MTGAFRAVGAFCVFGKLPSRAEFLHVGPNSALLSQFDAWLTDSVEWAHARNGSTWDEAFRAGTMRAFMYRGAGPGMELSLVVGALAPSRDEAGRLYPICVAAPVIVSPEFMKSAHLLPLACEEIWQVASESLAALHSNPDADLEAQLAGLPEPSVVAFSDAEGEYAGWREALQLWELDGLITGSKQSDALRGILRLVAEAVQPYRKQESPNTPLSLRLPLGAAGGAAVCFWLDAVRRLVGWRTTVPSLFWSHDGDSGQLTVHLGAAPVSSVSELWLPSERCDEFCDLTSPLAVATVASLPPLPGASEQLLLNRSSSIAQLLAALDVNL